MFLRVLSAALACVAVLASSDAGAYRMIQNTGSGRTSFGTSVPCDNPAGFAHWTQSSMTWRFNPANQGGKAGMLSAFQAAMASWNGVSPAPYTLGYAGTTSAGFATDGINAVSWGTGNGCTGGCLALTALVLASGQVITEADFFLNDAATWNVSGSDYDAQAIMAHELGHSLGIHHTDQKSKRDRPTMYASYIGTSGRSLSGDDQAALNCAFSRYPPAGSALLVGVETDQVDDGEATVRLVSRPGASGTNLRFALERDEPVRLDIYDVAGRHLATLVDGSRAPGEHEVAWDGTTGSGQARPGVYFARLRTPEGRAGATIVFTR